MIGYSGWGVDNPPNTFAQFLEAAMDIHDKTFGYDPVKKQQASWSLDFLNLLGDLVENVHEELEFISYKMVRCPLNVF